MSDKFKEKLTDLLPQAVLSQAYGEFTLLVEAGDLLSSAQILKKKLQFELLLDIAGVDYLHYGQTQWHTDVSSSGFGRARTNIATTDMDEKRFALSYHLLSVKKNQRLRLQCYLPSNLQIDSVIDIWPVANWYEREAFDLFGFLFKGHPDLRRILTDYGFIGHPLRKDFPTVGEVQMRYDETQKRVVYEPVDIEAEVNVPKVIREL